MHVVCGLAGIDQDALRAGRCLIELREAIIMEFLREVSIVICFVSFIQLGTARSSRNYIYSPKACQIKSQLHN